MSDIKYIKLKAADGTPCVIPSAARYLTISLPQLSEPYRNETLHLQVNYTLANGDSGQLDTGLRDADRALVSAFDGSTWNTMPEGGFSQTKDNPGVMVDLGNADSDHYITYTWYYVQQGIMIHVTPAASTKLTATAGIPKHSELQDREETDQHPIKAITGLEEALTTEYRIFDIKTDEDMLDVEVAPGKVATFIGYNEKGKLVLRYKTSDGTFGTIGDTGTLTAHLEEEILDVSLTDQPSPTDVAYNEKTKSISMGDLVGSITGDSMTVASPESYVEGDTLKLADIGKNE